MEKNEKKVLDAMKKAGKPVRPGDVAKTTGVESKDVSKIITKLKKRGESHLTQEMLLRTGLAFIKARALFPANRNLQTEAFKGE